MKITNINKLQNAKFPLKSQIKEFKKETVKQNQTSLISNSLSEAMGRSQVAFKGTSNYQNNKFSYTSVDTTSADSISYNEKTGDFKFVKRDFNGNITSSVEFFHDEKIRIETEINKKGDKTVITTTDESTITQVFNKNNQIIREKTENSSNGIEETIFDYKNGRKIININGEYKIYDLVTGKQLFDGDLVYLEKYDEEKNADITLNLLTNKIIREKQYYQNGEPKSDITFDEKTGKILKKLLYSENDKREHYQYFEYDKNTFNLINHTYVFADGISKRTKLYNPITGEMISDTSEIYDNGVLISENECYLNTDRIKTKKIYGPETCTVSHFTEDGDMTKSEKYKNGRIIQEEFYGKNSNRITKKIINDYEKNLSTTYTYHHNGKVSQETIKNMKTDSVIEENIFYADGKINTRCRWNENTGECTIEYHNTSGIRTQQTIMNEDKGIEQETFYYADGQTPKKKRQYFEDGSYKSVDYDRNGDIVKTTFYNKYGKVKYTRNHQEDYQQNTKSSHNFNYDDFISKGPKRNTTTSIPNTRQEEINFFNNILRVISSKDSNGSRSIKESDMQKLAKLLGVEEYKRLYKLDDKTYKNLARKFHPDMNEDKEKATMIMQILNALRNG